MFNIDIQVLNDEEKQALVCLYFARLDSSDPRYKKNRMEFFSILSKKYGKSINTYKNDKDAFDRYFDNREGWKDKPIEKRSKVLRYVLDQYGEVAEDVLEKAVYQIIGESKQVTYISCRIIRPEVVAQINKTNQTEIIIDDVYTLENELYVGNKVFIALGGDKGKKEVNWETGFYAVASISKAPFEKGYKSEKRYFKFGIVLDFVLPNPMTKDELVNYPDTYGAPYIGLEIRRDPTQAICLLEEEKAVAVIRAALDKYPDLEETIKKVFPESFVNKVLGPIRRSIDIYLEYGQKMNDGFPNQFKSPPSDYNVETKYEENDFLDEVFIEQKEYEQLKNLLLKKKNLILQGAPGVGKTFMAKRLAYSILGSTNNQVVTLIQFHQSYSYEDFVIGYKPEGDSFEIKKGPFYTFCKNAQNNPSQKYFFLLDEINRGDISKIFGELLMAIETDKRGEQVKLLYSDEDFCVPPNVYIIGMMNTADRSIAIIDYALRRRFAFYDVKPALNSPKFIERMVNSKANTKFNQLIQIIRELNKDIIDDDSLGKGFEIGHSYFCTKEDDIVDDAWIYSVITYEILPLLNEYWFDDSQMLNKWEDKLKGFLIND